MDKILVSKDNVKLLIEGVENKFDKKFQKLEIEAFYRFLNSLNIKKIIMKYKDIENINKTIIDDYYNIYKNKMENVDIHKYLAKKITSDNSQESEPLSQSTFTGKRSNFITAPANSFPIPDLTNLQNQIEFVKIFNNKSLWRDSNILIDSRYQSASNFDKTKIVFNIVGGTRNKTVGSGTINTLGIMQDIVELEIFPFSIPYVPSAENYYNKITLSLLEMSASGMDTYEDSQFHFMFSSEINGNLINLTPINRVFRFSEPIPRINALTLVFGSPLFPIEFQQDKMNTSHIDYESDPGELTFPTSHNLKSGDLIYITDFTTISPAADVDIINEINDKRGYICTRVDSKKITINVNFTKVTVPNRDLSVSVYFGSKRILMPMRIRYLYNKEK